MFSSHYSVNSSELCEIPFLLFSENGYLIVKILFWDVGFLAFTISCYSVSLSDIGIEFELE